MSINVKSADDDPLGLGSGQQTIRSVPTEAPDSIISRLRQKTKAQQVVRIKAFPVGGEFGEWLQIRYKPLPPEMLDDFIAGVSEVNMQRAIQMNMDMMSRACVEVIGVDQDTKEVTVLKDEGGHALKLDNRLAVLLEMPNPTGEPLTAREVITLLFGNNGLAIGEHGDKVTEWMRSPEGAGQGE